MNKETVLITGATSGIGLELAREFAKHGHSLFLTGRVEEELASVANELREKRNVLVQTFAQDLEESNAEGNIFEAVQRAGMQIDILINNAGLGYKGKFWEIPEEKYESILRVNVLTVLRLTRLFLPQMIQRGSGKLVNTASIAGFQPGPLLAVYHASKAFVLSLTESLAAELADSGITVTAICPGATDTDFFPKADMEDTRIFQKGNNVMAPQEVAAKSYKAIMKGDPIFVPGGKNKLLTFSRRFLTKKAQAKLNEKFYEDVTEPQTRNRERGDVEAKLEHN
jgi:short-subunit dehydrogenase